MAFIPNNWTRLDSHQFHNQSTTQPYPTNQSAIYQGTKDSIEAAILERDSEISPAVQISKDLRQSLYNISSTFDTDFDLTNATVNSTFSSIETPYWSLEWRIALGIILSLIILSALLGNVMVIMVIVRHRGMRTRTNMFLCSLSCSDLLCTMLNMPLSLVTVVYGYWPFNNALCYANGFIGCVTFVTSIHTLMYIAVHKYMSIKWPFSHVLTHFRILLMVMCAWLWGIIVGYLTVHGLNWVEYRPYNVQCTAALSHDVRTYFHSAFIYVTCYLIPLIVMTFCYACMYYQLKAHALRLLLSTTTERDVIFSQQRRITCTLFIVLLLFMLCWTPRVIFAAYTSFARESSPLPLAVPLLYCLGYVSCALNPLIYAMRSPAFREGYRQILCCATHPSQDSRQRNSSRSYGNGSGRAPSRPPLGRFRQWLSEALADTRLHASGSLTGSPAVTPPTSRKSSMTSLTHYLLFPKSRTLSTNSLPGNFRFSVPPLIVDKDTTQVSFIAGIPVLTKGGKIVTYTNPHEAALKKRPHPVYYPRLAQLERKLLAEESKKPATETSPLIPPTPPLDQSERPSRFHQSTLATHLEVPEIFIQPDVQEELRDMCPEMPRLTGRPSCESGFNDVEHISDDECDDQVFVVVADIEAVPRDKRGSPATVTSLSEQLHSPGAEAQERAGWADQSTSDTGSAHNASMEDPVRGGDWHAELLRVPMSEDGCHGSAGGGLGGLSRQRVCKSASDACERGRPLLSGRPVTKSTSDTCIQESIPEHTRILLHSSTDESSEHERSIERNKKVTEKSLRSKFLHRLFSRSKSKGRGIIGVGGGGSVLPPSSKNATQSSRTDLHCFGETVADDISDSGMVSGVSGGAHDSPSVPHRTPVVVSTLTRPGDMGQRLTRDITSHSFSAADSRTRKVANAGEKGQPDVDTNEATTPGGGHRALALSRSSSDPSLSQSKSSRHSKSQQREMGGKGMSSASTSKRRAKLRKTQQEARSKRHSRDSELNDSAGGPGMGSELRRSKSIKPTPTKYPSVEQLDRVRLGSEASVVKRKLKRLAATNPMYDAPYSRTAKLSGSDTTRLFKYSKSSVVLKTNAKYWGAPPGFYRCVSDPCLSFKNLEEKVLQRSVTRKWQRAHKRGHRRTTTEACKASTSLGAHVLDTDYRSFTAHPVISGLDSSILRSSSNTSKSEADNSFIEPHNHSWSPNCSLAERAPLPQMSSAKKKARENSKMSTSPSHESYSGKYLHISLPLNEYSPICLSNLSLHHISQPECALMGHVVATGPTYLQDGAQAGHVTAESVLIRDTVLVGRPEISAPIVTDHQQTVTIHCPLSQSQTVPPSLPTSTSQYSLDISASQKPNSAANVSFSNGHQSDSRVHIAPLPPAKTSQQTSANLSSGCLAIKSKQVDLGNESLGTITTPQNVVYSLDTVQRSRSELDNTHQCGYSGGATHKCGYSGDSPQNCGYSTNPPQKCGYSTAPSKKCGYSVDPLQVQCGYSIDLTQQSAYTVDPVQLSLQTTKPSDDVQSPPLQSSHWRSLTSVGRDPTAVTSHMIDSQIDQSECSK